MAFKIGLFSLKGRIGVTTTAIHMANFIAGSDKTVALLEYEGNVNPKFSKAKAEFDCNGTFTVNNVRYYPAEAKISPMEDIIIIDYGEANVLFEFPDDLDKLYLCIDSGPDSMAEVEEFLLGRKIVPDILLFSHSQVDLRGFLKAGYKAVMVGNRFDKQIDYNLAMTLSSVLRKGRISPPEYHRNWEYDQVDFVTEMEGVVQEKKWHPKDKKKIYKNNRENVLDTEEKQIKQEVAVPDGSGVSVAVLKQPSTSHLLFSPDFENIPLPTVIFENAAESRDDILGNDCENTEESNESSESGSQKSSRLNDEILMPVGSEYTITDVKRERNRKRDRKKREKEEARHEKQVIRQKRDQERTDAKIEKEIHKQSKIAARRERKQQRAERHQILLDESDDKATLDSHRKKHRHSRELKKGKIQERQKGILGKLIYKTDKEYDKIAHIFLVTKMRKIYIFRNTASFFSKLEPLLREVKDSSNIECIVITYMNDFESPKLLSKCPHNEIRNPYILFEALDIDLEREDFTEEDLKDHKELQMFSEIIIA